jgi:hypothetical protein
MIGIILLLLLGSVSVLTVIDFFLYLLQHKRVVKSSALKCIETFAVIVTPLIFIFLADFDTVNDCCSDSAFFAPPHRLTIYVLIVLCAGVYFYSSWRTKLSTPLLELLVNCFLLMGVVLNIFISIQAKEAFLWLSGNLPIIALFLTTLIKNHQLLSNETFSWNIKNRNLFGKLCNTILRSNVFIKYPLLLILCLPLLIILALLLLIFGQEPDSAIKAFTETYKHGLSQWDYMCDNVQCGGHYLCSVAANGHSKIVKPQRYGERNGTKIICNRQLLISNAFEELIEDKFPRLHRTIRKKYDHVGNFVHRFYNVFNNKFFSDVIYFLMKPLEWFFLVTLYLFDQKPENRIAQQYLNQKERLAITDLLS